MTERRPVSFWPTPAEILALGFAAYLLGFIAGSNVGAALGIAAIGAGIVLSRLARVWRPDRDGAPAVWIGVVLVLVAVAPFIAEGDFRTTQMATGAYIAIGVMGLNLLSGYTGQVSIGHSAFLGIGGYTTAIVVNEWNVNFFVAIALGTLIAALAGVLLGIPALRLTGPYLAIATLGLAVVFAPVLKVHELESITGGRAGLNLFAHDFGPPVSWSWLSDARWYYLIAMVSLLIAIVLAHHLTESAVGRSFRAVRDGELAAAAAGINVAATKLTAFAISSAYAGFAGGLLFLLSNRFVSPESFSVLISIEYLVAMVIGGMATIEGSLIGAFFLVYMYRESIDDLSRKTQQGSDMPLFIAGVIIALIIVFGSTWVTAWVRRNRGRVHPRYGALALHVLLLAACVAFGILFTAAVRKATEGFLDLVTLRGALTGLFLILTVIALPEGVAGVLARLRQTTWRGITGAVRDRLLPPAGGEEAFARPLGEGEIATAGEVAR